MIEVPNGAYSAPVAALLSLGKPAASNRRARPWNDYQARGITEEHVPDLIRMATDEALNREPDTSTGVWAPLHAWRALGQLGAFAAVEPLLTLADQLDDDPWLADDLPVLMSMIGGATLPYLEGFLANADRTKGARVTIASAVARIGQDHADLAEDCRGVLRAQLVQHAQQPAELNASIVSELIDLGASADIDLIREAYSADDVDLGVAGDIEEVEIELGLRSARTTAPPPLFVRAPDALRARSEPVGGGGKQPTGPLGQRKIGRNEACPCGSGRKYKRCCGRS